MSSNLTVINLFGGPGSGKSTTAAALFALMKQKQFSVELITEYAKDIVWEKRHDVLSDQLYITAKQHRRLLRLCNKVSWVVSDGPLLHGLLYKPENYHKAYDDLVMSLWSSFENLCFFVDRVKPYVAAGRMQTEQEAREMDKKIHDFLHSQDVSHKHIVGTPDAAEKIFDIIGGAQR